VRDFDVIICGGGLVGLTLANALGSSNLSVALIDGQDCPLLPDPDFQDVENTHLNQYQLQSGYDPRVSAINVASKNILENLGVWQNVNRICAFDQMSVRDASGSAQIKFFASDIKLESLGYIVENRQILAALANNLSAFTNITCFWNTRVKDIEENPAENRSEASEENPRAYLLHAEDKEMACDLLVGADGGNSRVRELADIKTLRWRYDQEALVTTIQTELPHGKVARQWFTQEGPLAFLPLADPHYCSIVWSLNDVSQHKNATPKDFCASLNEASENELGKIVGIDERFSFPLAQQHAFRYVKNNLALIGDAAHTIHPLAGQGANLGFADASALASELKQAKFSESGVGDLDLLRRYEKSRQAHNLLMTSVMEALKRLYTSGDPGVNWLRNTVMKVANDKAVLKTMMTRLASGL
jgi:2-octaprenylphenol hydroxylase